MMPWRMTRKVFADSFVINDVIYHARKMHAASRETIAAKYVNKSVCVCVCLYVQIWLSDIKKIRTKEIKKATDVIRDN